MENHFYDWFGFNKNLFLLTWRHASMLPKKNVVVFVLSYAITSMLIAPAVKVALDFQRPLGALGEHADVILGGAAISILIVSAVHYLTGTAAKPRVSCGPDAP